MRNLHTSFWGRVARCNPDRKRLSRPPLIHFARLKGSTHLKYSGQEIGEAGMELTAVGIKMLKATRGQKDLLPQRRQIAMEIRKSRNLTNTYWK